MITLCKECKTPNQCQLILEHCVLEEEAGIAQLEDMRQSEAFYETYLEDKKYEEEQIKDDIISDLDCE